MAQTPELSELYNAMIDAMREKLQGEPTAADLGVIRQFLRDQNYEAVPVPGSELEKLGTEFGAPPFDPEGNVVALPERE